MDRAVLGRRVHEVFLATLPVEAGRSAHGQVDAGAVEPVPRDVADTIGGDAVRPDARREIPAGEEARRRGLAPFVERLQFSAVDRAAMDLRTVELAVEVSADDRPRIAPALDPARHHRRHARIGGKDFRAGLGECIAVDRADRAEQAVDRIDDRRLADPGASRRRIEAGGDRIPDRREQRLSRSDGDDAATARHRASKAGPSGSRTSAYPALVRSDQRVTSP